jgi:hypothetical protein
MSKRNKAYAPVSFTVEAPGVIRVSMADVPQLLSYIETWRMAMHDFISERASKNRGGS